MSKYKLIIEYYQKGNNSQIATLCACSRTTVWTVLKRIKALGIEVYALNDRVRIFVLNEHIKTIEKKGRLC